MPALNNFGEVLIQALQAGEQAKRARLRDQQEDEERKLRIDAFKHQQKELELEGRYKAFARSREGDKEAASALEGQPLAQLPTSISATGGTIGSGMNTVPDIRARIQPQQIRGSEEFGVKGYEVTPKSVEQIIAAQTAATAGRSHCRASA